MGEIKSKSASARVVSQDWSAFYDDVLFNMQASLPFSWYQQGEYPLQIDSDGNFMTTDDVFGEPHGGNYSGLIIGKDYQFNIIPQRAKIKGIKVKLATNISGSTSYDVRAYLQMFGINSLDNKATGISLPTGYQEYGGAEDLWGYDDITPAQIMSADFGFAFSVFNNQTIGSPGVKATLEIEYMEITVYYDDIHTEDDEVIIEQDKQSEKQFFCKVYDKGYNYLNTINIDDLTSFPIFNYTAKSGFGSLALRLNMTYQDFVTGDGTVTVDGADVQTTEGSAKLRDTLKSGNIIDIFVSDRDSLNKLIYSGIVDGYTNVITEEKREFLTLNILPNTITLISRILREDDVTLMEYFSEDPADIIRDILDRSNSFITYDNDSIPETVGVKRTYSFNCTTIAEALAKIVELCPDFWVGFVDANGLYNLKYMYDAPVHTITPNQINSMETNISMLSLSNVVYFLGGGDTPIFKKYENSGSQNTYGTFEHRIVDERVTVASTAEQLSQRYINQHKDPTIDLQVTLLDNNFTNDGSGVDIEKFEVGDKIILHDDNYSNAGREWGDGKWGDGLWGTDPMRIYGREAYITGYTYMYDRIILKCTFTVVQSQQRVEDINRDLKVLRLNSAPSAIN